MKKKLNLAFALASLLSVQTMHAQSVDDIVDKYIASLGGKEKLLSLKTVRMEGNMSVQGTDVTLVITKEHMVGTRADIGIMGVNNYQVVTPDKGVMFMPVQGMTAPADMPVEQVKAAQTQLDLQGALLNYKDKGTKVALLGKEKVDKDEAYNMQLTFKNGIISNYYISASTYRLVKSSTNRNVNGQNMLIETTYNDYKQNADGYWFPYSVTSIQGETTYDKIETNKPVDASIFK